MRHHALAITPDNGSYFADCICGWVYESVGTDESSRNAAKRAAEKHEEVAG